MTPNTSLLPIGSATAGEPTDIPAPPGFGELIAQFVLSGENVPAEPVLDAAVLVAQAVDGEVSDDPTQAESVATAILMAFATQLTSTPTVPAEDESPAVGEAVVTEEIVEPVTPPLSPQRHPVEPMIEASAQEATTMPESAPVPASVEAAPIPGTVTVTTTATTEETAEEATSTPVSQTVKDSPTGPVSTASEAVTASQPGTDTAPAVHTPPAPSHDGRPTAESRREAPVGHGASPTVSIGGPLQATAGITPISDEGPENSVRPSVPIDPARPTHQPSSPLATTPVTETASPLHAGVDGTSRGDGVSQSLMARIESAIDLIENAPPPRRITIMADDLDGVRLTVAMRPDGVSVTSPNADTGMLDAIDRALAARGFDLADSGTRDRRHEHTDDDPPTPSNPTTMPRSRRSDGIRL